MECTWNATSTTIVILPLFTGIFGMHLGCKSHGDFEAGPFWGTIFNSFFAVHHTLLNTSDMFPYGFLSVEDVYYV